jgi:hypothetical protein
MKHLNSKLVYSTILLILILKYIKIVLYPWVGCDGPWSLSPAFSYVDGIEDSSVFAHDFLGKIFTVHFVDFFYFIWFKLFGISTFSFVNLQFVIIISTLLVWDYLSKRTQTHNTVLYLLMLGYVISPYVFGFRLENFTILVISLSILGINLQINQNLKLLMIAFFCVFSGLIHPIGGLIHSVLLAYYFVFIHTKKIDFYKFVGFSLLLSVVLTKGEIINYLLLPTKVKSEVGNHLSGFDFGLLLKYLIYSGPIPIFILFLYRKIFIKREWIFTGCMILILSFLGRSYYWSYLYVVLIFVITISNQKSKITILDSRINTLISLPIVLYSLFFLVFIPFFLVIISPDSNKVWRAIISKSALEKLTWNKNIKYFTPTDICLELVSEKNTRLLYPYMHKNDGIQNVKNTFFYITSWEQLKWIRHNFDTKNTKICIQELVKEHQGQIVISSLYKFKTVRQPSFGLWKVNFVQNN